MTLSPEKLREWRKIVRTQTGPSDIRIARYLLGELLDQIPDSIATNCAALNDDWYAIVFEVREGRLSPWTTGRTVMACEIRSADDEVVGGSEVTISDAWHDHEELVRAYHTIALGVAAHSSMNTPNDSLG